MRPEFHRTIIFRERFVHLMLSIKMEHNAEATILARAREYRNTLAQIRVRAARIISFNNLLARGVHELIKVYALRVL